MARLDMMLFDMIVPPDRHGSMKWHNSVTLMTTTKKNQHPPGAPERPIAYRIVPKMPCIVAWQ